MVCWSPPPPELLGSFRKLGRTARCPIGVASNRCRLKHWRLESYFSQSSLPSAASSIAVPCPSEAVQQSLDSRREKVRGHRADCNAQPEANASQMRCQKRRRLCRPSSPTFAPAPFWGRVCIAAQRCARTGSLRHTLENEFQCHTESRALLEFQTSGSARSFRNRLGPAKKAALTANIITAHARGQAHEISVA